MFRPSVFTCVALAVLAASTAGASAEKPVQLCGATVDEALAASRTLKDVGQQQECVAVAIERLAQHVENLRTGEALFGNIRAKSYLYGW